MDHQDPQLFEFRAALAQGKEKAQARAQPLVFNYLFI